MKRILLSNLLFFVTGLIASPNFILMGPPGVGKGTFAQFFVQNYGYAQISAGDIFRKEVRENTELGKKIKVFIDRGEPVDEATAFEVVSFYINKALDAQQPFVVDANPRSEMAMQLMSDFFKARGTPDYYIIHFVADLDELPARVLSRVTCGNCFAVFNEQVCKPQSADRCDQCGYKLDKRKLDTQEVIVKRIKHYQEKILPLVLRAPQEYNCPVVTLDTNRSLQDCYVMYQKLYEELKR